MDRRELPILREKLGLNQTEMAKRLNTPLRTYLNWERGERPIPGLLEVAIELLLWKDNVVMRAITESIGRKVSGNGAN